MQKVNWELLQYTRIYATQTRSILQYLARCESLKISYKSHPSPQIDANIVAIFRSFSVDTARTVSHWASYTDVPGQHYTLMDSDHVTQFQKIFRDRLEARGL
jgi:hypothetical protein